MIFISHTYSDKPVIEPVAMRLRDIFGEDKVFYDAWSIQPGDGIMEQMNKGLTDPRFVFFFVSEASLKSKMVEMEWQNALMKATKGACKIIPVRVDGSPMPALLTQTLYIDMFSNGIEVATQHIIGVIQGTKGFEPAHEKFSNLTWSVEGEITNEVEISIRASHLMEPNPYFLVLLDNDNQQTKVKLTNGSPSVGGYNPGVVVSGKEVNAWAIAPIGGAITPKHPLRITITSIDGTAIVLRGIMHKSGDEMYTIIPPSNAF